MADTQAPLGEASAMNARVEILEVEQLVEGADYGTAESGELLFGLFAERGIE